MDRHRHLVIVLAIGTPLVLAGLAGAWSRPGAPDVQPQRRVVATVPPAVLDFCHRSADMLHEVTWAAACYARRDDNDCMLPDSQAARVNALLDAEASRCLAVETQQTARR